MASAQTITEIPARKSIPKGQLLIDGQWRDAANGETMPTFDPATEEKIADVAKVTVVSGPRFA